MMQMDSLARPLHDGREFSHEEKIAALIYYQHHPVEFAEDVFGVELEDYQRDILNACVNYSKVAAHTGHGVGKTMVGSMIVLWWMFCFQMPKAITTAPTWRQVKDLLWAEIHYWMRRADLSKIFWDGKYSLTKTRLEMSEDVYATGESSEDPTHMEGYHAPNILYLVDEAKSVEDSVFESIDGALTSGASTGGRSLEVLLSTPGEAQGKFYNVCSGKERGWRIFHVPGTISRRVDRLWIEDKRQLWGEESFLFKTRVLGEFDERAGDSIISFSLAQACGRLHLLPSGYPELGVDVARGGADRTVVAIRHGDCLMAVHQKNHKDTVWTADFVTQLVDKLANLNRIPKKSIRIKVDDTGVGAGVTDILKRRGHSVIPIVVATKPNNQELYRTRRDELWFGMADRISEGRVDFSRIPYALRDELAGELAGPRYAIDHQGRFIVEPKDKTRSRIGKSPDLADAVILAYAAPPRVHGVAGAELRAFQLTRVRVKAGL